jgi:histidine ammonia-lyase
MIDLTSVSLTIDKLVAVARHGAQVAPLSAEVIARMDASRAWVEYAIHHHDAPIYGVNTGFGPLAKQRVAPEQARQLSRNLILNCLAGVGAPLPPEIVRAMMLIRAHTLTAGYSGARPLAAQTLIDMLNAGVTPVVPGKGSLGASGDLAPLAHIAVVFTRDPDRAAGPFDPSRASSVEPGGYSGQAWHGGVLLSGAEAMARAGIARIVLEAKEGLALTNGTDFMLAAAALGVQDAENLLAHAEIAAALSLEALLGLSEAFHPALHEANRQPGQIETAANIRALTAGSRLLDSAPDRVQDAYSLRCIPQVLGPVRDTLGFLHARVAAALNAVSDNPLIFHDTIPDGPEYFKISGGNFHGQGPAMWLNFLSIALSAVGNIAERRTFRLLTPELSEGLPSMLARASGLDSALMIPQYTAAALVSDNKTLAHPDSTDSIPSSANQEDFVSMGANAARHALEIVDNVRYIVAIELLAAAQAVDLRPDGPARLGRGTRPAYQQIRRHVAFLEHDRETAPDIERLAALVQSGEMLQAVREAAA